MNQKKLKLKKLISSNINAWVGWAFRSEPFLHWRLKMKVDTGNANKEDEPITNEEELTTKTQEGVPQNKNNIDWNDAHLNE